MEYSEEKLQQLSLSDLIVLKLYLVNDRIKFWSDFKADEVEGSPAYQDYNERIQLFTEMKDLAESVIADRLTEIFPEYDF